MSRVERHKSEYSKADREAVENIKPSDDPKDLDFTYGSKPEGRRAKAAADKKEAKAAPEKKAAKSGQKPKSRAERNASPDDDLGVWDQTEEEKKKARQEARAMGDGKPEFHAGRALGKLIGFIGTLILIVAIVACLALFVPHYAGIEQNERYCVWAEKRLEMAEENPSIQGYTDGVFGERNTNHLQKKK